MKTTFIALPLFLVLWLIGNVLSQTISGYVLNQDGEPLVGTNIYVAHRNLGTTTNLDGYYLLKLPPGEHTVIFSYLGYRSDTLRVRLVPGQAFRYDVVLSETTIPGEKVYVFAQPLSDAEQIILKTIDNKSHYLSALKNYVYQAYNKTVLRVNVRGKQIIGGILETQSRCYYQYPDHFEEIILARRQSANFSEAHNIFTLGKFPNVLEEVIKIDDLPVVSPLSRKALDYYTYEMIDTTYQDGRAVFNIRFSPARNNVPLFSGQVSILDHVFAPVYIKLIGNQDVKTAIRESIVIEEKFRRYEKIFYLPVQVTIHSVMKMGVPGVPPVYMEQFSLLFDYQINSPNFHHSFKNKLLHISLLPPSQSDSLWRSNQILPLSEEEQQAYRRIDSIVTHASLPRKMLFTLLRLQPTISRLPVTQFSDFYHFNRVEGHTFGLGLDSRNHLHAWRLKLVLNWGLSDHQPKYSFHISHRFHNGASLLSLSFFHRLQFQDAFYRYSVLDISLQSLLAKNDYANYYSAHGIEAQISRTFRFHTRLVAGITWSRHSNVDVHTNFSLLQKHRRFLPNPPIDKGTVGVLSLELQYDNRKFYDYGWLRQPDMTENFLVFDLLYRHSNPRILPGDFLFRQFYLMVQLYRVYPPYFHLFSGIKAGWMEGDCPRQYLFHLPGSYGSFSGPMLFRSIPRDEYRGSRFLSLFLENNFRNILFNLFHLPYLQKSKYNLFLFVNMGWINSSPLPDERFLEPNNQPLTEIGFGIGNILNFLRLDFTWRLKQKGPNFFLTISAF